MKKLENKVTFITGASAGIGEACARQFAEAGSDLLLAARSIDKLLKIKADLETKYGVEVFVKQLDVRCRKDVSAFYNSLPAKWQAVDILVNNAGLARGMDFIQDADEDAFDEMIDTNIKGLLNITKAFLPKMMERKSGHIINLGSLAGHEVYPKGSVYCATKFAVKALSKGFRVDLLEYGIKVTSVDPGMVETNFSIIRFSGDVEKAKNVYKGVDPLVADDIADAILFAATRPKHVNINEILMTPLAQGSASNVLRK